MKKHIEHKRNSNKTFTDKQKELFPLLAENKSDREIAEALGVTISTAYHRIERLIDVAKCTSRADLEAFCKTELAKEEHGKLI